MPKDRLVISLVQTHSTANFESNLDALREGCKLAKQEGAQVVAFGEVAYFTGSSLANRRMADRYKEVCQQFSNWAKEFDLYLLPGTLRRPAEAGKSYNEAVGFGPDGQRLFHYQKIFLFRATTPTKRYDESEMYSAGSTPVVFSLGDWTAGVVVCFDLRFPELFRSLRKRGANLIFVPSAFTETTGAAHWEVLLRARAIENQCFIVAPAITGKSGDETVKFGHSMVIDPWGKVIAALGADPGVTTVTIDLKKISEIQSVVDSWSLRREELFPIA
jgi:nitrilase